MARAHELYKALLAPVEDLIKGKRLLIVPSGPLTSLPFSVLVTEPPKAAIPAQARRATATVAWLGTRQPITVLPSVASLKALRQLAKASRASKAYLGIGNPLLDGPQDDPQWGAHYRQRAEAARAKQQCPQNVAAAYRAGRGRPLAGFAKLFRGAQADIEAVRRWTPLPETADELCDVAAGWACRRARCCSARAPPRPRSRSSPSRPARRVPHPALRHPRRARRPGQGQRRTGADPDAAAKGTSDARRWSATTAFSPPRRSPPSSSMPTG